VSLTGGEPLLRGDWPEIARGFARLGIQVKVVTNGVLLTDGVIELMAGAGVAGVAVSLDGTREVHDAIRVPAGRMGSRHEKALDALARLAASPLRSAAITQLCAWNEGELETLYEVLAGLGVEAWQVQLAYPLGRLLDLREDYLLDPALLPALEKRLAALIEDGRVAVVTADNIGYYGRNEPLLRLAPGGMRSFFTGCMAGCLGVSIMSNGDVKGCPTHPDVFVVGNVLEETFAEIWQDAARFSYNTGFREELLEGECAACPFRRVCRAGCTTMAWAVTGSIYDNPYCLRRART
jgi:radical SAM protein with 4Fe4S-binding SPASM domain